MAEQNPARRITALDGLRGLAITLVLLQHYVQLKLPVTDAFWPRTINSVLRLSWSGVDLFFVLSGFLIGGILIDHRTSPRLMRTFYVRRGVRILPLYYATLFVLFGGLHLDRYSSLPAWTYITFTSNFGMAHIHAWDIGMLAVTWSLAIEEQFYLIAPWVVRWIAPDRLPRVLVATVIVAWALRLGLKLIDPSGFYSHLLMPCRMDAFAFGILVAWIARSTAARVWIGRVMPRWWIAPLVLAAPLILLGLRGSAVGGWALLIFGYTCLGAFFASIVYAAVVPRPPRLIAALSWPPLVNLGRLSYFVYLWHRVVLVVGGRRLMSDIDFRISSPAAAGTIVICAVTTWLLAWISWRIFEGPLLRIGQRYAY